jgi:hypothetical protein
MRPEIPDEKRSRKVAMEAEMIDSVIFSLMYGPIAVTLACWLFFAIEAAREKRGGCLYSEPKTASFSSETPRLLIVLPVECCG